MYLVIFAVSIVSCVVGFALEIAHGNISHVENGREPNTGVALFPTIPVIPLVYLGAAWGINQLRADAGFVAVGVYACISIVARTIGYVRATAKLKRLLGERQIADA